MRIESLLRRLWTRPADPRPEVRDALERDAMARFSSESSAARRDRGVRRRWLALGLGAAAAVGACSMPADYDVALGHRLGIAIDGDLAFSPDALVGHLRDNFDVEQLRVAVRQELRDEATQPSTVIVLDLVGRGIDVAEVEQELVDAFPSLADARWRDDEMAGTVHGTFGGMLSHRMLDLVIDGESVEETKRRILDDLAAQGVQGHAKVEITDEETPQGHRREVRVEVEAEP